MDWYYAWAALLILVLLIGWVLTALTLPGNWLMVAAAAVFAFFFPATDGHGIGWIVVGVILLLAIVGELLELAAAAIGAGRVGASLLQACGLPELVANDATSYEGIALRLARNSDEHAALKAKLERNRGACALFDTLRFTRHLEAAYATMYEHHQRGGEPQPFRVPPMTS